MLYGYKFLILTSLGAWGLELLGAFILVKGAGGQLGPEDALRYIADGFTGKNNSFVSMFFALSAAAFIVAMLVVYSGYYLKKLKRES